MLKKDWTDVEGQEQTVAAPAEDTGMDMFSVGVLPTSRSTYGMRTLHRMSRTLSLGPSWNEV